MMFAWSFIYLTKGEHSRDWEHPLSTLHVQISRWKQLHEI